MGTTKFQLVHRQKSNGAARSEREDDEIGYRSNSNNEATKETPLFLQAPHKPETGSAPENFERTRIAKEDELGTGTAQEEKILRELRELELRERYIQDSSDIIIRHQQRLLNIMVPGRSDRSLRTSDQLKSDAMCKGAQELDEDETEFIIRELQVLLATWTEYNPRLQTRQDIHRQCHERLVESQRQYDEQVPETHKVARREREGGNQRGLCAVATSVLHYEYCPTSGPWMYTCPCGCVVNGCWSNCQGKCIHAAGVMVL